jgi:hypothetical protein
MAGIRIVVVGGGFSGCAAAIAAAKAGARVILLERSDILLAGGIRAGRMNFNGKLVAAEESKALGGGEVFEALESIVLHRGNIAEENHGYVYDTGIVEPTVRKVVESAGVEIIMEARAVNVVKEGDTIKAVRLAKGKRVEGEAFVDATGTSGGMRVCKRYGRGCVMCVSYRCLAFGDRVSIATKAGVPELMQCRPDGSPGLMSAALSINKASLHPDLRAKLEKEGSVAIPLPPEMIDYSKLQKISSIAVQKHMEYINLVDIGTAAKCVKLGYLSLANLRRIPGFEMAMIDDPLAGGNFSFIKMVSINRRDDSLKAQGLRNLFVTGEKIGPVGGVAEAIATGILAGNNAVRAAAGLEPLILPGSTAIGDYVNYTRKMMRTQQDLNRGYRMGHGLYFERMKELGLYTPDADAIHRRIGEAGLAGILSKKLV